MIRLFIVTFVALSFCPTVRGEDTWLLITSDFKSEPVALQAVDPSGVKVIPAGGGDATVVPMDRFLEVRRSLPAAQGTGKFVLHMTGGDMLGGEPLSLNADSLSWNNPNLGQIEIPTSRLIAITPAGKAAPVDRKHEDVVSLSNGDTVHGIIASMNGDKVAVQTDGGNSDVPLASVASIVFAATPGAAPVEHGFRIRLDDSSSLIGSAARLDGQNLVLTLGKGADRKLALAHISAMEQVNGPVSWLSSLTPSEQVYYPFLGPEQTPAAYMDRAWDGKPIQVKDQKFTRGIGVHAFSRLSWPLDGKFAAFRTRFAIAEADATLADATVRIKLDDKVVFEQTHVRGGALSPVIVQDLGSARKLTLEVDGATPFYPQDEVTWIEPAMLRQKPAATTRPATTQPAQ